MPVTPWAAACWACLLGIDAVITARLVYLQTDSGMVAALAGLGDLVVLAAVLGVAIGVLGRR